MAWRKRGLGHNRADADRICLTQRVQEFLGLANMRQCLRVAQVRMHVHQADFAAEECRGLRALEQLLQSAVIGHRSIEQADAIRSAQVLVDELQMLARLLRSQQVFNDRVDHRQRAVVDPGGLIARVQQIARVFLVIEEGVARQHSVHDQQALEILLDLLRPRLKALGLLARVRADAARSRAIPGPGSAASRSRRCTSFRAWPDRRVAVSHSSRRGRRRPGRCRG